jgi:alkylhydroperoxidase family enzyme
VPRLSEVRRADATSSVVLAAYDYVFGDRCPVEEPGTTDGTRGDWWTTYALVPDVLEHAVQGFLLYRSPRRALDPRVRELAQLRVGVRARSSFVERQHARAALEAGLSEEAVRAVREGRVTGPGLTPAMSACLAYVDALVIGLGVVPSEVDRDLAGHFSDEEMLELTYIATLYLAHAVAAKALQLEDDGPASDGPGPPDPGPPEAPPG